MKNRKCENAKMRKEPTKICAADIKLYLGSTAPVVDEERFGRLWSVIRR
jgi:hypothetical protein